MKVSRSRIFAFHLLSCLLLLALTPLQAAAATIDITVGDNFFSPANVTIQVGDTVRWNNAPGGNSHNVTADDGSFASSTSSSFTFSQTFNSPGSFGYTCTIHPSQMRGTITVEGGGGQADLSLQSLSAEAGTFSPGDDIAIDISIKNVGGQTSAAATITYYASTNSNISGSDIELGSDPVGALAADETLNYTANATFPNDIADGDYFIGAIIAISDADGSNDTNVDSQPITVTEAGSGFLINEGLNDAWFNALTPGQGFFITVFPDIGMMFLAWFTFDTERPPDDIGAVLGEPGHRWLTAFGPYDGDTATLDVELTRGGVFDSAEPQVQQGPDGTIEVTFSGCNAGTVTYDIIAAAVSGQVPIERIALDNVPFCEVQATAQ